MNVLDKTLTNGRWELPRSARGVLVLADPPERAAAAACGRIVHGRLQSRQIQYSHSIVLTDRCDAQRKPGDAEILDGTRKLATVLQRSGADKLHRQPSAR